MSYVDYETRRRAAIAPLYGTFAGLIHKLERVLTTPHFCSPPAGHEADAYTPVSITRTQAGELIREVYTCPECGLSWHHSSSAEPPDNLHILVLAACNAA
jgi:predicted RNA-binding Zn-ribbon protein involved in translation (DUF1610 family)